MKSSTRLIAISVVIALASTSQGAIILQDSDSFTTGDDLASHTFSIGTLSLAGGDKLVVTVGGEGSGNGVSNNTATGVTYGGVALNQVIQTVATTGARRASIWYLDLAGQSFTGSDFVVTYNTSQDGLGFGAYVLSGTAAGTASATASGSGTAIVNSTIQLTTLTDGEFVIGAMARNNFDAVGTGGDLNGFSNPLQQNFYVDLIGSSAASGSFLAGAAGTYDLIINDTTNGTAAFVGASFAAIPEPRAALLGGLGLLALLRRRR